MRCVLYRGLDRGIDRGLDSGWLGPNAFEVRVSGGGCAIKESVRNPAEGVVFFWTGACHRGERERGETYKPSLPYVDLRS